MQALGRQIAADFHGCPTAALDDTEFVEAAMEAAAQACGATVIQSLIHHFNPIGVSGVVVIAESHLAIHTWPEHGFAAVDIFTCGEQIDPSIAVAHLKSALGARHSSSRTLLRGRVDPGDGHLLHNEHPEIEVSDNRSE